MTTPTKAVNLLAFFTMLLVALMMGSNHVAARLSFDHGLGVATAVAVRSLVCALAVSGLVLWGGVPWRVNKKQLRGLVIVGFIIGVQSQCLYAAVSRIPVALALVAFNTFPLWTALWERVFYGKTPKRIVLQAMPVILVGLFLALDVTSAFAKLSAASNDGREMVGIALALFGAAIFGIALVVMQHETDGVDGRTRTAITMWLVSALALAVMGAQGGARFPTDSIGWTALIVLSALYGTAFTIMFTVLPKLGVGNNSVLMNAEPIFSLVVAWVVLGQTIAHSQIAGALVVVSTVMWLGLRKKQ